jgi:hypothetical protein
LAFLVNVDTLPRLDRSFCKADAVVLATVTQVAMSETSSDPEFVRLRVTRWIKGEFREAACFRIKGNLDYRVGSYLVFLAVTKEASAAYAQARQAEACSAETEPPLLDSMLLPSAVDDEGVVQLDPQYVVLAPMLLGVEESLALRDKKLPASFALSDVERFFGTLSPGVCSELGN